MCVKFDVVLFGGFGMLGVGGITLGGGGGSGTFVDSKG